MKDFLHLRAPGNWINDPNGFLFYRGQYHLFYQHYPHAPHWGTMHWGHAVSPDLVHWEHLGVALCPSTDYDRDGVFSGSALEIDGRMQLYYTAIRACSPTPENAQLLSEGRYVACQATVSSPDGLHFDNLAGKRPIIPVLTDPRTGHPRNTRDPKVWREGHSYYMVLGSTRAEQEGRLLFYRSADGLSWSYANQYTSPALGTTLECPDLMPLGDGYLLLGSPMGVTADGLQYPDQAMYARADFDPATCAFSLREPPAFLDWGLDLYAPQSTLDREGRRVWVGWMRMPKPVSSSADGRKPWNGMMSLPRLVQLRDGQVCFPVHPNVTACFTRPAGGLSPLAEHRPVRMTGTLRNGQSWNLGGYRIRMRDGYLEADRSAVFDGLTGFRLMAHTPRLSGNQCRLDVFVDENLIEVFVDDGRYVISHVVYGLDQTLEGSFEGLYTV